MTTTLEQRLRTALTDVATDAVRGAGHPEQAARQAIRSGGRIRRTRRVATAVVVAAAATVTVVELPGLTRTSEPPASTRSEVTGTPAGGRAWWASLPERPVFPAVTLAGTPPTLRYRGEAVAVPAGMSTVRWSTTTAQGAVVVGGVGVGSASESSVVLTLPSSGDVRAVPTYSVGGELTVTAISPDGGTLYFLHVPRETPRQGRYGVLDLTRGTVSFYTGSTPPNDHFSTWGPGGLVSVPFGTPPIEVTVRRPDDSVHPVPRVTVARATPNDAPVMSDDGTALLVAVAPDAAASPGQTCYGVLDLRTLKQSASLVCRPPWQVPSDIAIGPGGAWLVDGATPIEVVTGRRGAALVPLGVTLADLWSWQDATTVRNRVKDGGGEIVCSLDAGTCGRVPAGS